MGSVLMSLTTTEAPSAANLQAMARPMPEAAPVTTAVRPWSRMSNASLV
jgi:hypothetical protein